MIRWEVAHGCAVFWTHVGNGGSVSNGKSSGTRSEIFDEFTNNTTLSEHLSTSKDEISGSRGLWQFSGKLESDDFRKNHGNGFSEHDGLTFDTTDTPTNDTETVDHGSVGVSSDDGVGIQDVFVVEDDSGEVFKVDLMADTGSWRNGQEVLEGGLSPFQELKSFVVSLEFDGFVLFSGVSGLGDVDLDRVIDDEVDWDQRIDLLWVATESLHGVSHGSQIDNAWDSCEILQEDSSRLEGDFDALGTGLFPVENLFDVLGLDVKAIAVSEGAFEEDSDGVRKFLNSGIFEGWEREVVVGLLVDG